MTKIGLQTFTIRRYIQKEKEIDKSFKILNDKGIKYLELAYVDFNLKNIQLIKKYLDKYQLQVMSIQIKYPIILKHYDEIVQILKLLNATYIAISVIPFRNLYLGRKRLIRFVNSMNKLGKRLKNDGFKLLFHHHNYEFIKYGHELAIEIIINNMNPKYVNLLMDTYWISKGGFNVLEFLKNHCQVIKGVHLRGIKNNRDTNLLDSEFDFKPIIDLMNTSQIPYGAIEQNTKEPFSEIEKSIKQIQSLGGITCLN